MVNGKFWRENEKKDFFGICLIGWERRKVNCGAWVFSLPAYQKFFSLKWGENWKGEVHEMSFQKYPHVGLHLQHVGFFFPLIFSFFVNILASFFLLFFPFDFVWVLASFIFFSLIFSVLAFFFFFFFFFWCSYVYFLINFCFCFCFF